VSPRPGFASWPRRFLAGLRAPFDPAAPPTLTGAALSGALAAAAFPPSPLWPMAWVALLPLYRHFETGRGWAAAAVAGLVYHSMTVYWIALNCDPPPLLAFLSFLGALVWLGSLWALAGGLSAWLVRRLGPAAIGLHGAVLMVLDWWVESGEMGFPWNLLGATQADNPLLRPLAAIGGLHALTLAVALLNWLLYRAWRASARGRAASTGPLLQVLGAGLLLVALGSLASAPGRETGPPLKVLLVQGNIPPEEKWDQPYTWTVERHLALSDSALDAGAEADLVIWSETAVPTRLRNRPALLRALGAWCERRGLALLTGTNDEGPDPAGRLRPYNASFLLDGSGVIDEYRKIRLVPFGERVPGQRWIPALGAVNLGQAEFAAGDRARAGRLPLGAGDTLRFGWSICFEGNFGSLAREMALDGAELLTNQTNDAWFGVSRELDQHLAIFRLRAVETGRWLLRATNNGYSAVIDERGRVRELLPKGLAGTIAAEVPRREAQTFYLRYGDLLPRLALLLLSWALLLALFGRGHATRSGAVILGLLLAAPPAEARGWLIGAQDAARLRSMGGCFAAGSDWSDARQFNPAALPVGAAPGWSLRLDPLAAGRPRIDGAAGDGAYARALPWLLPLRSLRLAAGPLHAELAPGDWLPADPDALPADADGGRASSRDFVPSLSLALAFDSRVSLGLTLLALRAAAAESRRLGVVYGALLRANPKLDVGAQAVYLPTGSADRLRAIDRIGDGTVNIGLLVHPLGRADRHTRTLPPNFGPTEILGRTDLRLALDVRNVTQEEGLAGRQELHLGASAGWFGLVELRGGVYWPRTGSNEPARARTGLGIGLTPLRSRGGGDGPPPLSIQWAWLNEALGRGEGLWTGGLTWTF
jgi:apolipoprotein N-acyltransferase